MRRNDAHRVAPAVRYTLPADIYVRFSNYRTIAKKINVIKVDHVSAVSRETAAQACKCHSVT